MPAANTANQNNLRTNSTHFETAVLLFFLLPLDEAFVRGGTVGGGDAALAAKVHQGVVHDPEVGAKKIKIIMYSSSKVFEFHAKTSPEQTHGLLSTSK